MTYNKNLDTLLDLNGIAIEQVHGYWVKFEVKVITPVTEEIPHGIRYSLTLHDRHGKRMMGFDNAHTVKSRKKSKYQGSKTYDHCHQHSKDEAIPYEFVDAHQLLKDFWLEVDKTMNILVNEE